MTPDCRLLGIALGPTQPSQPLWLLGSREKVVSADGGGSHYLEQ